MESHKIIAKIGAMVWVSLCGLNPVYAALDQEANDMLSANADHSQQTSVGNAADTSGLPSDENSDRVVKWGVAHNKKIQTKVTPISDSSFASEANTPNESGSTNTAASRSPASDSSTVRIEAAEKKQAAKTIVRNLAKRKAYQEVSIIVNDLGFFPATLFVTQGIPVRLFVTGASKKSQCFMMDTYGIRRQIQSQKIEEITFTPEESGSFTFSCPMNGAKGVVLVKELELDRMPANLSLTRRPEELKQQDETENSSDADEANVPAAKLH